MNAVLLAAIGSTLKDFKESRDKCRAQMAEAIQLGERLGVYIAKAKSHHRSHLTEYLRDYQKPRLAKSNEPRPKPSLFSHLRKMDKAVSQSLERRGIDKMDAGERSQLKDSLTSIARVYVELCQLTP